MQKTNDSSTNKDSLVAQFQLSRKWLKNPYQFLDENQKKFGNSFFLNMPGMGKTFLTGDATLLGEIKGNRNLIGGRGMQFLRPVLGNSSVIMQEGTDHLKTRKNLSAIFNENYFEKFSDFTHNTTLSVLAEDSKKFSKTDTFYDLVKEISLQVITKVLYPNATDQNRAKLAHFSRKFLGSFSSPLLLFIKPLQVDLGEFSPWGRFLRNRNSLINQINQMQKHCSIPNLQSGEVLALLMFGHETAAAASSWVADFVYNDFSVLNKIRSEQNDDFLLSCIYEAMRLRPPVVHLTRVATEDTVIGPHKIPAGSRVLPCQHIAHRQERIFSNPSLFDPERFLEGPEAYGVSYFPFGIGRRVCIGKALAIKQMRIVLDIIFKEKSIKPKTKNHSIPERRMVIMIPKGGLAITRLSLH